MLSLPSNNGICRLELVLVILRHAVIATTAAYSLYYLKNYHTDDEEEQYAEEVDNNYNENLTQQQHSNNVIRALSGSLGSALSITIFYPLETVRTRLQVDSTNITPRWSFLLVYKIFQREGFKGLYRGWLSLLVALMSLNFVYFYTFHFLRVWLLVWNHNETSSWRKLLHHYYLRLYNINGHKMVVDLIAGYLSGCVAVIVTGPLWLVNTRLKLQGVSVLSGGDAKYDRKEEGNNNNNNQYSGMFHCLHTIYKQEGLLTLWKGTLTSIILSLNPAIQLAAYEMLKRNHLIVRNGSRVTWWIVSKMIYYAGGGIGSSTSREKNDQDNDGSVLEHFINALLSKFFATLITYPIQLIQTRQRWSKTNTNVQQRQQQQSNRSKTKLKRWVAATMHDLMEIIQQQGFLGLYRGLESKLMQTCLNSALMFVTYEKLVEFLTKLLHHDHGAS